MFRQPYWRIAILLLILILGVTAVSAQEISGTVSVGQPTATPLAAGQTVTYSYTLSQSSNVSLQVFGDTVQPTVTILRDGEVVFSELNAAAQPILTFTTFLNAGDYFVQIGSANNAGGTVVIVITAETPVTPVALTPSVLTSAEVTTQSSFALFSFNALNEPAYLYIDSALPDQGVNATLVNTTTGAISGMLGMELTGGRLSIPASAAAFQIEVSLGAEQTSVPFTVCLVAVSIGGCEGGLPPAPTLPPPTSIAPPTIAPTAIQACTLTPASGGSNIRQSATTASIIVGFIPGGQTASVIGISPDGSFYNVIYNNVTGWVSRTVATVNGNCANVPVINPPPVIFPTATNTPIATIAPPATLAPPPTPSGPCLITVVAEFLIYSQPNAIPDYIQDEVGPGYELIPTGRLADDSWWVTNYAGAWIQTGRFGSEAMVTGDCRNLPVVSAP